jgi:hypothetical protein
MEIPTSRSDMTLYNDKHLTFEKELLRWDWSAINNEDLLKPLPSISNAYDKFTEWKSTFSPYIVEDFRARLFFHYSLPIFAFLY